MIESIVHWGITACLALQLGYWVWFHISFRKREISAALPENALPPVSVIVCYKNEAGQIHRTLNSLLAQQYPSFEVIAMDDGSTDDSRQIVESIQQPALRSMQVSGEAPGKKRALSEAILSARYTICLMTDADCKPATDRWIRSMAETYLARKSNRIVLGIGPTVAEKGFLNAFQRYETNLTAMQYVSYAKAGIPYMGVGRNLMYERALFLEKGGFENLPATMSGDDDLFINRVATASNVAINLDADSFVFSAGKPTLPRFLNQKARHISTSPHYKAKHTFLLTLFAAAQVAFYGFICLAVIMEHMHLWQAGSLVALKWIMQMILQATCFTILRQKRLNRLFPLLDLSMVMYYLAMPVWSLNWNKKW